MANQKAALSCITNHPKACSWFFIGRHMILRLEVPYLQALTAVVDAPLAEAEKWGRASCPASRRAAEDLVASK